MLLEFVAYSAYAGYLVWVSTFTVDKSVAIYNRMYDLRATSQDASRIQRAFRAHLRRCWTWQFQSLRGEATLRNVCQFFHVVDRATLPTDRFAATRTIPLWCKARWREIALPNDWGSECDDASSSHDTSDPDFEIHDAVATSVNMMQEALVTSEKRRCDLFLRASAEAVEKNMSKQTSLAKQSCKHKSCSQLGGFRGGSKNSLACN